MEDSRIEYIQYMPDIVQQFVINASTDKVYKAITAPHGINEWWSKECSGEPQIDHTYYLGFGPGYNWEAHVTKCETNSEFELTFIESDEDWLNTKVGFELIETTDSTLVEFYHKGWKEANTHYRISCFCWAMYMRILKRYVEFGEQVPYDKRLEV